jgi:hypothetical protein
MQEKNKKVSEISFIFVKIIAEISSGAYTLLAPLITAST